MSAAAATVKKVFLELGGKSANIILDDADFSLDYYLPSPFVFMPDKDAQFRHGFLFHENDKKVEEILINYFKMIDYGGDNTDTHIMGPLISSAQRKKF